MRSVERLEIDRREARLPVVRVDNRLTRAPACDELERRPDEQCETSGVVGVVGVADAVEPVAIVQLGALDEQCARAARDRRFIEADVEHRSTERDDKPLHESSLADAAIARQRERHKPAEARDRLRQRAEDVAEAPGLGERNRFGTDDENGGTRRGF